MEAHTLSCPKHQGANSAAALQDHDDKYERVDVVYHSERSRGISNLKIKMNG